MSGRRRGRVRGGLLLALAVAALIAASPGTVVAAWERVVRFFSVSGDPIPTGPPVLSDHEIERIAEMEPQQQAETLLKRSIHGFAGARELLEAELPNWLGAIEMTPELRNVYWMAMNAPNLRTRAAGIEVYLAAYRYAKTTEEIDVLIDRIEDSPEGRPSRLSVLGLLANRGVEPDRAFETLSAFVGSGTRDERYWAVQGLAYSGDVRQIPVLLEVFRSDPDPTVRERAACNLAQSGMLQWADRWKSLPGLLAMAEDSGIVDPTRKWVFQALRDITGESFQRDASRWREWWENGGREQRPEGRAGERAGPTLGRA